MRAFGIFIWNVVVLVAIFTLYFLILFTSFALAMGIVTVAINGDARRQMIARLRSVLRFALKVDGKFNWLAPIRNIKRHFQAKSDARVVRPSDVVINAQVVA